ncbi:DUF2809 domain-containing protein [Flaviflagellibacter deserti]|uniref:DUF2809 domain-containing protein n=1 Tax=Flaviflagellibacter deserti TaxID=2267266 RepID=A0ABV9Z785_9HYPH
MSLPLRLGYLGWVLAVIGAGLLLRNGYFDLSLSVERWGGSVMWGALFLLILLVIVPNGRLIILGFVALILAAVVELSQLWHLPMLEAVRATKVGAIMLGRTFSWWDIVCYWIGIAVVWFVDSRVR